MGTTLSRIHCSATPGEMIQLRGMLASLITEAMAQGGNHRETFGEWQIEAYVVKPYFLPAPVPLPPSRLRCSVKHCGTVVECNELELEVRTCTHD